MLINLCLYPSLNFSYTSKTVLYGLKLLPFVNVCATEYHYHNCYHIFDALKYSVRFKHDVNSGNRVTFFGTLTASRAAIPANNPQIPEVLENWRQGTIPECLQTLRKAALRTRLVPAFLLPHSD